MRIDPKDVTPQSLRSLDNWTCGRGDGEALADMVDYIIISLRMGVPLTIERDFRKDSRSKGVDNDAH